MYLEFHGAADRDSRRIQHSGEPCIVIAGSGMREGGHIVHHVRRGLENPKNSVVIVGSPTEGSASNSDGMLCSAFSANLSQRTSTEGKS